jgi:hypothetical protein
VKEKVKPAEVLHRLNAQYGEETLSHASVYDWYSKFPEICKEVLNIPHAHIQPTAVCDVSVCFVKVLIWGDRRIAVHCNQQWHKCWKCWNNYPWTLIVQESVYPVGLIDLKVVCNDGILTSWTLSIVIFLYNILETLILWTLTITSYITVDTRSHVCWILKCLS